jgi:tetratricopeptide (TPR) repeat protein
VDPRAYDLYMRGRYHWNRRTDTDLLRARDLFQQAVDVQPGWALGYNALAQTYLVMAGWATIPPDQAYPRAQELANKALGLDPDLGAAWASLAGVQASWLWEWETAEEYYQKAIVLEPNNASSHQWYAEFLVGLGRFDAAIEQIEIAQAIDPLAPIIGATKAWIYFYMGDFKRAVAESERVVASDSTFAGGYVVLGDACRYGGHPDRAAEAYARYFASTVPGAGESIRNAYARGGIDAVMRTIIHGMRQASQTQYISPANMGFNFASIGEADSAMVWLEKAYNERAYPIELVAIVPRCQPIHNDPRFLDLLRRMNLDRVRPAYARN